MRKISSRPRILLSLALPIALAAAVTWSGTADAAPKTREQKCRLATERQSRRYLIGSMRERQRCLKQIFKGKMSAVVDCIEGTGDIKLASKLQRFQSRVSVQVAERCVGADLALLGFPGTCPDPTGEVFDVLDLSECIISKHDEFAVELLNIEFPPVEFVPPVYQNCIARTGGVSTKMLRGDMNARQDCLFAAEVNPLVEATCLEGLPPYGQGTLDPNIDNRIRRAHVRLLAGVPAACGLLDVEQIGFNDDCPDTTGGSFSVFDLKLCIYDSHRNMVNELIEVAFPGEPVCGDGVPDAEEECDDGNRIDSDACTNECRVASCGDGVVQSGVEDCDDGNANNNDACLNDCTAASCGDGFVNPAAEDCDDGNARNDDSCLNSCELAACGDGVICTALSCVSGPEGGPEDCDDGNASDDDFCGNDCGINFCGDGETQEGLGEECDDGNTTNDDGCRNGCKLPFCGDGIVDPSAGEECDDGNTTPGDNCDESCQFELCGNGVVDSPSEECDDGNASNNDACLNSCRNNVCRDGFVNPATEECDDGNANDNDACLGDCTDNVCGDGFVNTGIEACDDGNASNQDACLNDCSANVCGDGFLNSGVEDCDDGAANSDTTPDACRANCTLPACGDGVVDPSNTEQCDDGAGNSDSAPDACRGDCSNPSCGDGVTDPGRGEQCDSSDDAVCQAEGSACGSSCTCANECPSIGEAVVYAGTGTTCTSDAECGPGTCESGRCRTRSRLDSGWTGIAHNAGVTDRILVRATLDCDSASAPCGVCDITGIDPSPGYCRCANDNRTQCFQPLAASDNESCGGAACECYLGPPLALSAGNTPACVVNKIRNDISGTGNVDTGAGSITTNLASVAHLGITLTLPCPACGGTCAAPAVEVGNPCSVDADCDTQPASGDGDCSGFDTTAGDGVRGGTCHSGVNEGLSCDVDAYNTSFPAPATAGEAGMSLDCFPDPGKNVSGSGLKIDFTQSTATVSIGSQVDCGFPPFVVKTCHCGICSNDRTLPCQSDDECGGGTCVSDGNGMPLPNQCAGNGICNDLGDGRGICDEGPSDNFCDGILKSDGSGFIACLGDADCAPGTIGLDAGSCSITTGRSCFQETITAVGEPNPNAPFGAAVFCIPPTSNGGINTVAGLPGPGRVLTQSQTRTFCSSDPSVEYTPGVGGCP